MLSATDLCAELEISRRSLSRWLKSGCPHQRGTGRQLLFDPAAVKAWMERVGTAAGERGVTPAGAERDFEAPADADLSTDDLRRLARLTEINLKKARQRLLDLELERRRGELVEREEVVVEHARAARIVRSRLEALPALLAPRLVAMHGEPEIHELLLDSIRTCLAELSREVAADGPVE